MIVKILQTLLLITGLVCCGCRHKNIEVSSAPPNSPALIVSAEKTISEQFVETENINTDKKQISPVIAYYFHRTIRCPACLAMEANADRIIKENFSLQIADGSLMWLPFNLDDPGGDELSKKFDISVSSLVITKMKGGKYIAYKKLEKVWQLLGDKEGFSQYITEEIIEYLL